MKSRHKPHHLTLHNGLDVIFELVDLLLRVEGCAFHSSVTSAAVRGFPGSGLRHMLHLGDWRGQAGNRFFRGWLARPDLPEIGCTLEDSSHFLGSLVAFPISVLLSSSSGWTPGGSFGPRFPGGPPFHWFFQAH